MVYTLYKVVYTVQHTFLYKCCSLSTFLVSQLLTVFIMLIFFLECLVYLLLSIYLACNVYIGTPAEFITSIKGFKPIALVRIPNTGKLFRNVADL